MMGYGPTVQGLLRCIDREQDPFGPDIERFVFAYIDDGPIPEDGEFENRLPSAGGVGYDSIDAGGVADCVRIFTARY